MVQRRPAQPRAHLRAPLGERRGGARRPLRGRRARVADLGRGVASGDAARRVRSSSSACGEGDRVAIYMPMCPAVAVASHACAHIGAVQVPIFSGFAAPAIASRLEDSQAKVVICADWSLRRGKRIEMTRDARRGASRSRVEYVIEWNRETRSVARRRDAAAGRRCRRSRSTPRRRTCSRTRRARPAGRRARCTCRAASSSRSRARSPTRSTSSAATASTSRPTWAGSWARGPSSAAAPSARRSSSPRARPTGRTTGSGGSSSRSR